MFDQWYYLFIISPNISMSVIILIFCISYLCPSFSIIDCLFQVYSVTHKSHVVLFQFPEFTHTKLSLYIRVCVCVCVCACVCMCACVCACVLLYKQPVCEYVCLCMRLAVWVCLSLATVGLRVMHASVGLWLK